MSCVGNGLPASLRVEALTSQGTCGDRGRQRRADDSSAVSEPYRERSELRSKSMVKPVSHLRLMQSVFKGNAKALWSDLML